MILEGIRESALIQSPFQKVSERSRGSVSVAAGIRDQLGKSNYDKPSSSLLLIQAFLLGKRRERWKPGPEELQPTRAHGRGRAQSGGHHAHELP
ncbi:MAG: hypothetical protein NTV25_00245 [Methanothrix sp.]|nr:hypothetical protein [Methanothrix sp.]